MRVVDLRWQEFELAVDSVFQPLDAKEWSKTARLAVRVGERKGSTLNQKVVRPPQTHPNHFLRRWARSPRAS